MSNSVQTYAQTSGVVVAEKKANLGLPVLQSFKEGRMGINAKYLNEEKLLCLESLRTTREFEESDSFEEMVEFKKCNMIILRSCGCYEFGTDGGAKTYIHKWFDKEPQLEFTITDGVPTTNMVTIDNWHDYGTSKGWVKGGKPSGVSSLTTALAIIDILDNDGKVLLNNFLVRISANRVNRSNAWKAIEQEMTKKLIIPVQESGILGNIDANTSYFKVPIIMKKTNYPVNGNEKTMYVMTLGDVNVDECLLPPSTHNDVVVPVDKVPMIEHIPTSTPVVLDYFSGLNLGLEQIDANPKLKAISFKKSTD
jgi:hypothetical protein